MNDWIQNQFADKRGLFRLLERCRWEEECVSLPLVSYGDQEARGKLSVMCHSFNETTDQNTWDISMPGGKTLLLLSWKLFYF